MSFFRFRNFALQQKSSLVLIFIGLFSFLTALSIREYQQFQQNVLSFSEAPKPVETVEEGDLPERITVSKVKIDLPVLPAKVVDNQWEISKEGAFYLLGSGIPGRKGNVVIYGHNQNNLLGPIRWLEPEDKIIVSNKKRMDFIYQIVETKTVSPQTTEVLAPTEDATLTLYTCTGFLDKDRFVIVAKLHSW